MFIQYTCTFQDDIHFVPLLFSPGDDAGVKRSKETVAEVHDLPSVPLMQISEIFLIKFSNNLKILVLYYFLYLLL